MEKKKVTGEEISIDFSIIPLNSNKTPKGSWKEYQSTYAPIENWYHHYISGGNVGMITGRVNGNFECIDIDSKNDPQRRIAEDYKEKIPESIYSKLVIVSTPSGGKHYYYRCPDIDIEPNQKLASHKDGAVIIETRGEGGYVCNNDTSYTVEQGILNLALLECEIQSITAQERELLLETARSLNRFFPTISKKYISNSVALNGFNDKYNIIPLFEENNWKVVKEDSEKIYLLRNGSTANHSGVYFKSDKVFFCFSTSTNFIPGNAYNNFQILQIFSGISEYHKSLKLLEKYGFKDEKTKDSVVSDMDIADYLNSKGVQYNKFTQEITKDGKIIEEIDNNTLHLMENFFIFRYYLFKKIICNLIYLILVSNFIALFLKITLFHLELSTVTRYIIIKELK